MIRDIDIFKEGLATIETKLRTKFHKVTSEWSTGTLENKKVFVAALKDILTDLEKIEELKEKFNNESTLHT